MNSETVITRSKMKQTCTATMANGKPVNNGNNVISDFGEKVHRIEELVQITMDTFISNITAIKYSIDDIRRSVSSIAEVNGKIDDLSIVISAAVTRLESLDKNLSSVDENVTAVRNLPPENISIAENICAKQISRENSTRKFLPAFPHSPTATATSAVNSAIAENISEKQNPVIISSTNFPPIISELPMATAALTTATSAATTASAPALVTSIVNSNRSTISSLPTSDLANKNFSSSSSYNKNSAPPSASSNINLTSSSSSNKNYSASLSTSSNKYSVSSSVINMSTQSSSSSSNLNPLSTLSSASSSNKNPTSSSPPSSYSSNILRDSNVQMNAKFSYKDALVGIADSQELVASRVSRLGMFTWLHLSKLNPRTKSQDIVDYVRKNCPQQIEPSDIFCKELIKQDADIAKLDFVSFKLRIPNSIFDMVWNTKFWPRGIVIRKFIYIPKNEQPTPLPQKIQ